MNVLMVRPEHPMVHPLSFGEKTYPMGMAFLIAALREQGHQVTFVDRYLCPQDPVDLPLLLEKKIDLVGVYICSITYRGALRLLDRLQCLREKKQWRGLLAVGGPHVSLMPESIPDYVDHVVIGEGENALLDIAAGRVTERTIRPGRIPDLDVLPFPAYDVLLKMPYHVRFAMMDRHPMANMSTSRGCPYNCNFCSVRSIWGKEHHAFSAARVVGDMEKMKKDFNFSAIYFREDNFLLDRRRTAEICEQLIARDLRISWGCEARVTELQDEETVAMLKSAGCEHVFLGLESLVDRVLKLMNKKIDIGQIEKAVRLCRKYGIVPFGSFIIGVPGESEEERRHTIEGARAMFSDREHCLNTFMGIPSSKMYIQALTMNDVEYLDPRSRFFYTRNHDALMEISLGGDVQMQRRSPAPYRENINNANRAGCQYPVRTTPPDLHLVNPEAAPLPEQCIPYHGLMDLLHRLNAIQTSETALFDNMLHLLPPEDLTVLLQHLKDTPGLSRRIWGCTPDRGDTPLQEAIMQHYFAEHIYKSDELKDIFLQAGYRFDSAVSPRDGYIAFEAFPVE